MEIFGNSSEMFVWPSDNFGRVFGKWSEIFENCQEHHCQCEINDENTQFGFPLNPLTFLLDRGNDNWLINYEKTPEVDRQVEGEEGVSTF